MSGAYLNVDRKAKADLAAAGKVAAGSGAGDAIYHYATGEIKVTTTQKADVEKSAATDKETLDKLIGLQSDMKSSELDDGANARFMQKLREEGKGT